MGVRCFVVEVELGGVEAGFAVVVVVFEAEG